VRPLSSLFRPEPNTTHLHSYLRRLQEAAAAAAAAHPPSDSTSDNDIESPISSLASPSQNNMPVNINSRSPPSFHEPTTNQLTPLPCLTIPPSRYPIAADTYHAHYTPQNISSRASDSSSNGISRSNSHSQPKVEDQSYISSQSDSFSAYPLYNWAYKQHQLLSIPVPTTVPPLSYYYRPRRLDEIAPRETISLIIALFFDFVYPLTPCIHKPSFMADLHSRREERDPLFFALVMSTLASTLVQVPRSYLPMERPVVRKLAQVGLFILFFKLNLAQLMVRTLTKQADTLLLLLTIHQHQCML
jgi:hypothetical protein